MTEEAARNALWHALGYRAKKETNRDALAAGETPVKVTIAGQVGKQKVREKLEGMLSVSPDQVKASSSAAEANAVVALLLEALPKTRRAKFAADLAAEFKRRGELPTASPDAIAEAKQLLIALRSQSSETSRGAVRFA